MLRVWLKELRLSKKLTQEEMASRLGITQTMYSKIENVERQEKMDLELASKLSSIFRISLKRIHEYEEALKKKESEENCNNE